MPRGRKVGDKRGQNSQRLFFAKVYVRLKKGLADPQGLTVKEALESLGYRNLIEVRFGKYIEAKLKAKCKDGAEHELKGMCERLLINPIIEEYDYHIEEG